METGTWGGTVHQVDTEASNHHSAAFGAASDTASNNNSRNHNLAVTRMLGRCDCDCKDLFPASYGMWNNYHNTSKNVF